ncbi:hypothetical protein Snoj_16660 [Streptomyces nojiriensis]|uniref:Uncharacterized protein n=1 Tax=Streptomyces nojiriensis TaxID=66374 RepID=A0ABQ3SHY1_9ACTN|nr:hypothetical protein GCM10010205_78530 [Streptomyces nojiriensis]GHI67748.1 hypothetical protein Snoj_16660 [Streptomyces nojiriensis]
MSKAEPHRDRGWPAGAEEVWAAWADPACETPGDAITAGRPTKLAVELGRDPLARTPADVGLGRLRTDRGANVLED